MKSLFFASFFFIYFSATADFLIVSRTGNLRESPTVNSEMLEKLKAGDTLLMLDDNQVAGYYHVMVPLSGQEGWVYRTLVRRFPGEIILRTDTLRFDDNAVVEVRILDVGAGLCNLIKLPDNKFVIYDAGGEDGLQHGTRTYGQIKQYIPEGSEIELLVLSHTDADHITAAGHVIRNYRVKKVLWSGYESSMISGNSTAAYRRVIDALHARLSTENVNLNELDSLISPGTSFNIGNARFTFLCGFGKPLVEWDLNDRGEKLNSVSIVMKLEYAGNSILFCGDAVGRHRDDPEDALIATEAFLVENAASFLPSTVVVAPHHGARNGSSRAFAELVEPDVVIFSAGHKHVHPATRTANVFLQFVESNKIYRTDLGDDEGAGEWNFGRVSGCTDLHNDDDIQVQLRSNQTYRVFYVNPQSSCRRN